MLAISFVAALATLCRYPAGSSADRLLVAPASTGGSAGPNDVLVIGAGGVGRRAAVQWLEAHPGARAVGATLTEVSHGELRAAGIEPVTTEALGAMEPPPLFSHVVFAAPPRYGKGAEPGAYQAAVAEALRFWAGPTASADASFVFTSSASVFAEDSGGTVTEGAPLSYSPSAKNLLAAERLVLEAGGTVLRLAGLYDVNVGPHAYWLKSGVVRAPKAGLINFVHYDDAAAAVTAALGQQERGKVFVIADGSPLTRADIIEAALGSRKFSHSAAPTFEPSPPDAPPTGGSRLGKVLDATLARETLKWSPKYASFRTFMATV